MSIFVFRYFNKVSGEKNFKVYFALIYLKTNSQFNFTLKDMYNLSYIQTLFLRKNVNLMDS